MSDNHSDPKRIVYSPVSNLDKLIGNVQTEQASGAGSRVHRLRMRLDLEQDKPIDLHHPRFRGRRSHSEKDPGRRGGVS
jgi:hypothetical protein